MPGAWAAAAAGLSAAIGMCWTLAALLRRRGSLDARSGLYMVVSLMGSELAVVLAAGALVLAGLFWLLGAARHPAGQFALLLHGVAVAGLAWAWLRGLGAGHRIDAVTGVTTPAGPRKLDPAHWLSPMRFADRRVQWLRDLPYVEGAEGIDGSDPLQRLDVIKPRTPADRPRPVLINIHGGGWIIGNKGTQSMPLLMHMARCGWLVIDADYRLSPKVAMPEHLIDVKRVIAWARRHAAEHGGNPDYLVITGGSAGGHLAALAALTANRPEFQPGFEEVDTTVQAALPLYGKYDFLGQRQADAVFERFMLDKRIMPGPPASHGALWRAMDPASQVHADAPPFLLLHGSHDALIPPEEAQWFAQRLRAVSRQPVLYAELPHAQHAWDVPHSLRSDLTVEALQRHLERQHEIWQLRGGALQGAEAQA